MNTDASGFSLEEVASKIKPHIANLSFRRLRDYTDSSNLREKVHGIEYLLELWAANTRLPANMDCDWKAYALPLARKVFFAQKKNEPIRFVYFRAIILSPSNDSVLWAFQELEFVPQRITSACFQGSSEICALNDGNFQRILRERSIAESSFWEYFGDELVKFIAESAAVKSASVDRLEKFRQEWVVHYTGILWRNKQRGGMAAGK